jgi:hypothetical protein
MNRRDSVKILTDDKPSSPKPKDADAGRVLRETAAFVGVVDELYGVYLDANMGFQKNHEMMSSTQLEMSARMGLTVEELDKRSCFIGKGDPDDRDHALQHTTTQGEFKARNETGGHNSVRMAQLFMVLVFEHWEELYRPRIASSLNLRSRELKVPVLGDIRLLRNDILHNHGVLAKGTADRLEAISGLEADCRIILDEHEVDEMVKAIKAFIDKLVIDSIDQDPGYRARRQVAPSERNSRGD